MPVELVHLEKPLTTLRDLADRLGAMPLDRVVWEPPPGRATEADAKRLHEAGESIEFVDGVLLQRPVSDRATRLTGRLREVVAAAVARRETGLVLGTDALLRLSSSSLRTANVVVIDVPREEADPAPAEPVLSEIPPLLAVDILGPRHTGEEMEAKLNDYFAAGTGAVWYVYPALEQVHVYDTLESFRILGEGDTLDGGETLPGFSLPLVDLFRES